MFKRVENPSFLFFKSKCLGVGRHSIDHNNKYVIALRRQKGIIMCVSSHGDEGGRRFPFRRRESSFYAKRRGIYILQHFRINHIENYTFYIKIYPCRCTEEQLLRGIDTRAGVRAGINSPPPAL